MKKRFFAGLLAFMMMLSVIPAAEVSAASLSSGNLSDGVIDTEAELIAAIAANAGATVTLGGDVTTSNSITINEAIILDLNGYSIIGTDNSTGSFGLVNINPGADLTINDSSTAGTGKIELTATNDRGWDAYSSVISNQRGKVTVNGGTIEHLGGTDMAYGIDNLTNGNGTYAETVINGGTVKSPYRAIRQFLNGTDAQNILTVTGGTIEGANKSIWMQDPSKNANSGELTVAKEATLVGNVYLDVTEGSKEWPVEVSVADAAFADGYDMLYENVPGDYHVVKIDGIHYVKHGVAVIGNEYYETLQKAFDAVKDGEKIEVLYDIIITETTAGYTDGTYTDGVRYNGDQSFTVDFGTFTVTDDGCVNDYLIYINNKGGKANEITFQNGTIQSKNGCWATVCVGAVSSSQKTMLELNGVNVVNSNGDSYPGNEAVRVRGSEAVQNTVNVNLDSIITSDGASYGVTCSTSGANININSGSKIIQKNSGTSGGNNVYSAVGGKGIINIREGAEITSDMYGVHTMTTGTPVVNIYGGIITANDTALVASTNGGTDQLATINVFDGTINGALKETNSDSIINVSGGTFTNDPTAYLVTGYETVTSGDVYKVGKHEIEFVEEVSATCTATGTEAHYKCDTCDKLYSDAAGKTEVTTSSLVIAEKSHTPKLENVKEATCTEAGYTGDEVCTVCRKTTKTGTVIEATGHNFVNGKCANGCGTEVYAGDVDVLVQPEATDADVAANISPELETVAQEVAKSVEATTETLHDAVEEVVRDYQTKEAKTEAVAKLKEAGVEVEHNEDVVVVVKPHFETEVKEVVVEDIKEDEPVITVEISLVYDVIVTTADNQEKLDPAKCVTIAEGQKADPKTSMVISFNIEKGLLDEIVAAGKKLYMKHPKANGDVYYHEAKLTKGTEWDTVTFVNNAGYSEFTLMYGEKVPENIIKSAEAPAPAATIAMFAATGEYIATESVDEAAIAEGKAFLKSLIGDSRHKYELAVAVDLNAKLDRATKIKILVDGVTADDAVIILHKGEDGWEVVPSDVYKDYVVGKFTDLSPVLVYVDNDGAKEAAQSAVATPAAGTAKPAPTGDSANIAGLSLTMIACAAAIVFFARRRVNK